MHKVFQYLILFFSAFYSVTIHSQVKAKKANDFVNSIGVATHMSYSGVYANEVNLKNQLVNIGIKHIRDGLDTKYSTAKYLANYGIKITGVLQGDFGIANQTPTYWLQRAKDAGAMQAFEAFEGPNEADLPMMSFTYKGQGWPEGVKAFQKDLFNAVKNDSEIRDRFVLGPTIGSGVKDDLILAMGNIENFVDFGNFHYYKAWGESYSNGYPGWDLESMKNLHNTMFGNKPYMSTEGSYHSAINAGGGISELVNAKYTLRFFLEYWRLGVVRTFKYELFDEGTSDTNGEDMFGLIKNDGTTIKPAGTALKDLITLLSDTFSNSTFEPDVLDFSISNADSYTHSILLQKSNKKFYLILWNDATSWDEDTKTEIQNADDIILKFNQPVANAALYIPCSNGISKVNTFQNPTSLNITVLNHPMIFEISLLATINNELDKLKWISIFPNPTSNQLLISGVSSEILFVEIFAIDGKLINTDVINNNVISIENLQAGIYIIKIKTEIGESVHRFIKE